MRDFKFYWVSIAIILISCEPSPSNLSPRVLKKVDSEFRKMRNEVKRDQDSLCLIFQKKVKNEMIDSLLSLRIKEYGEKRIIID